MKMEVPELISVTVLTQGRTADPGPVFAKGHRISYGQSETAFVSDCLNVVSVSGRNSNSVAIHIENTLFR